MERFVLLETDNGKDVVYGCSNYTLLLVFFTLLNKCCCGTIMLLLNNKVCLYNYKYLFVLTRFVMQV